MKNIFKNTILGGSALGITIYLLAIFGEALVQWQPPNFSLAPQPNNCRTTPSREIICNDQKVLRFFVISGVIFGGCVGGLYGATHHSPRKP